MTRQQEHAAKRLVLARARARDNTNPNTILELQRAEARYEAACKHVRPPYLKGERL